MYSLLTKALFAFFRLLQLLFFVIVEIKEEKIFNLSFFIGKLSIVKKPYTVRIVKCVCNLLGRKL